MRILPVLAISATCALLVATPARAQNPDSTSVLYALTSPSAFEIGCVGPCACPLYPRPLGGTFVLVPASPDPLYRNYEIRDIQWSFGGTSGPPDITGTGRYRIGGEFALTQELILDLVIDGRPSQHFDSGLQPGGSGFPAIDDESAAHGFACYDTVVRVDARPVPGTAGVGPGAEGIARVVPNPFHDRAVLQLEVVHAGAVSLDVLDPAGRVVRSLLRGEWLASGPHVVAWDGTIAGGRRAPPGLYLIRMRTPGELTWTRIAHLR